MTTQEIFNKINYYHSKGDIKGLIEYLENAWKKLEEPKQEKEESFHIATFLIDFSIEEKMYEKAEKWGEIIQTCALTRHDSGHREFLLAKAKYRLKKLDEAKELMNIAFKKSKGRCFENQDPEYKNFFNLIMNKKSIDELCQNANTLIEEYKFNDARQVLLEAWEQIPTPKEEHYESTWVKTSLGDIYFLSDIYDQALDNFLFAYKCIEGVSNPFINLRLGQCYYNLNDMSNAKEHLQRAYMLEGEKIFEGESSIYFDLVDK